MAENRFYLSSSPHFSLGISTQKIMLAVIISLLPECIYGIITFGLRALFVILTSVLSCVVFELLFQVLTKQKIVIKNLSAVVSGILLALVLPSTVPFWQVVLGAAVAMIIAKGLFGGIGSNVFNPALTGRAFLFISFPSAIGAKWFDPNLVPRIHAELLSRGLTETQIDAMSQATVWDGITSSTILSSAKNGSLDINNFDWLSYFFGNRAGCIGETSVFLILVSFVFLLLCRIIDWRAPLGMIATFALGTFIASVAKSADFVSSLLFTGAALLSGGIVFGATFMVTDYATTPVTKPGRFVFGAGCGLITFLIRTFGGYPEGVMFSILIMNAVSPFLNNLTVRKYGYGKKGNRRANVQKIEMEFDLKNAKSVSVQENSDSFDALSEGGKND